MKFRKWISAALAAVMVTFLAGCGANQAADTANTKAGTEAGSDSADSGANAAGADAAEREDKTEGGLTYADTIAWDGTYDVVVVGFGGAGLWPVRWQTMPGHPYLCWKKRPRAMRAAMPGILPSVSYIRRMLKG